jgi:hypothetical protein
MTLSVEAKASDAARSPNGRQGPGWTEDISPDFVRLPWRPSPDPNADKHPDGLRSARGIAVGVLLSVPAWLLITAVFLQAVR